MLPALTNKYHVVLIPTLSARKHVKCSLNSCFLNLNLLSCIANMVKSDAQLNALILLMPLQVMECSVGCITL